MSEERIELERSEEQVVNKNGKKKKRIVAIIITAILLLIISIGVICVLKYKEEHKYIPYEELRGEQIVLVTVSIGKYSGQIQARIHALDAEGDLYEMLIPTDKWVGIEYLYDEIQDNKIQTNYEYDEDTKQMYESILLIDKDAEMIQVKSYCNGIRLEQYFYAIRYMANGEMEYIKYGEEQTSEIRYCLDDPYALKIFPALL